MQHKKLPSNRQSDERADGDLPLQISLRGVEICQDTRPSNQPSLYKVEIPYKVRERKYPWIYCCGATLSMGEGAAGAFTLVLSYCESILSTP